MIKYFTVKCCLRVIKAKIENDQSLESLSFQQAYSKACQTIA